MKDDKVYLLHMRDALQRVRDYTSAGKDTFFTDLKTQDAVIRNFEIIGEAAKRVSEATRDRAPRIPWRLIPGFRDILIHQYEGVDLQEVWKRVEQDVPQLLNALQTLLREMGENL